jgi:hypothetical protein
MPYPPPPPPTEPLEEFAIIEMDAVDVNGRRWVGPALYTGTDCLDSPRYNFMMTATGEKLQLSSASLDELRRRPPVIVPSEEVIEALTPVREMLDKVGIARRGSLEEELSALYRYIRNLEVRDKNLTFHLHVQLHNTTITIADRKQAIALVSGEVHPE